MVKKCTNYCGQICLSSRFCGGSCPVCGWDLTCQPDTGLNANIILQGSLPFGRSEDFSSSQNFAIPPNEGDLHYKPPHLKKSYLPQPEV